MNFETLEQDVLRWAEARKIIPNSSPNVQLLKTVSELGELADATIKGNDDEIADGVGDVLVTLIIYCALQNIDPIVCLASAYDTIKDRRGTMMPNGVFVKDSACQ
jgi:NTP pyrophosphatase (non-canonical NTP hydrolase)